MYTQSPLMRGRGLKHPADTVRQIIAEVAPHAGAWIETQKLIYVLKGYEGRPSCGGVD